MPNNTAPPSPYTFAGYTAPNYTPVPDQLFDEHLHLLSGAELKVLLYICRRTFGFKRDSDNISLNQMLSGIVKSDGVRLDHGTGLSKSTLLKALQSLIEKNIVIAERRANQVDGNLPTNYRLNVLDPLGIKNDLGVSKNTTPLGIKNDLGGDRNLDQALGIKIDPTINSITTNSVTRNSNNNKRASVKTEYETVVVDLVSRNISKSVAEKLAHEYPEDFIREKIAFHDFLLDTRPEDIKKPAAWLRKAIEDDFSAPDGFISAEERQRLENEETNRKQAILEAQRAENEYYIEQQKQKEASHRQRIQSLLDYYETTAEDLAIWEQAKAELPSRQVAGALLASMQLVKIEKNTVTINVSNEFMWRQLSHPGLKKVIEERVFSQLLHRPVLVEFVVTPELVPE